MSPPAWAHLLFGGTYCYSCGAQRVTKILFSLRRRAYKSCGISSAPLNVPQEYGDMVRFDTGVLRRIRLGRTYSKRTTITCGEFQNGFT
ncbi:hypothetical protein BJV78DRAFT_1220104 [Lactifluus subvellereus]|nr:hypothetical protein BJV78DRAFT_1220104 [Lactifluus subvellereus]